VGAGERRGAVRRGQVGEFQGETWREEFEGKVEDPSWVCSALFIVCLMLLRGGQLYTSV